MTSYTVPRYCGIYYLPPLTNVVIESPQPTWLPQVSLSVNSTLRDTSSSTVLTQTFVNPSKSDAIEKSKYAFPLYESCAVVAFRCFVGKRLIQGIVKEKEVARVEYNKAIDRGETAGLLEMHTPDVFSTSIGNIPAGETVKVEIEYIMELKHDAEVDGLRFTIPTSIAPRYGDAPSAVSTSHDGRPTPGVIEKDGMMISVKLTMPSNIRSVQSPSHTISMHLGGHVEDVAEDAFNPKNALATLSQKSTELGADFVLLVKCADLSSPRALLETHPTIPNSKALMLTLVPKFTLPSGPKPEVVFVADRSGSMGNKMEPLKSALAVFLKSLPIGVKFNICSFGSSHSFLWEKSQPYSADTLDVAQKHVDSMEANFGGTEILEPIKATVSERYKDIPLEIMVLTDGEVWNTGDLFQFIEKETASGDIRVFSLGIGQDVSHALVEGMSRIGGGFSQIVSDEREGLEGKVVRMLRAGLSSHIKDYRLEWACRPSEEQAKGKSVLSSVAGKAKKIKLFDTTAEMDPPVSTAKSAADRFAHLPDSPVPTVIQAPYKIPSLFPFSRSTVYVILSGDVLPPSSVCIRGTTPSGDELELEIEVHVLPEQSRTFHQLAARKVLQELEEGTSYLHSGKYGVDKEKNAGTFSDWVDREGIRIGLEYGVASKWTSFVAVEKKKKVAEDEMSKREAGADQEPAAEIGIEGIDDYEIVDGGEEEKCDISPPDVPDMRRRKLKGPQSYSKTASHGRGVGSASVASYMSPRSARFDAHPPPPPPCVGPGAMMQMTGSLASVNQPSASRYTDSLFASAPSARYRAVGGRGAALLARGQASLEKEGSAKGKSSLLMADAPAPAPTTPRDRAKALIAQQSFEGYFPLSVSLAQILGAAFSFLQAKLSDLSPIAIGLEEEVRARLWATLLAIGLFERELRSEIDMWELVVEKAKAWVEGVVGEEAKKLEGLVSEVLGGLKG